jgi:ribosomal protein S18 acetylase RimI-like enzyme
MEIRAFERRDLQQVIRLCEAEGWESYCADAERTFRALSATNVICLVVAEGDQVIGFAQCLTDGAIRAYLANMAVVAERRGSGIGKMLVNEVLARCHAVYLDLLSADAAQGFYATFPHRTIPGYRIYPR